MNDNTSLGIVIGCLLYFMLLFLFFTVSPPEILYGHTLSGVSLSTPDTVNSTVISDGVNTLQIFASFATFSIEGIPNWLTIVGVYVPTIILLLGIYGLVRGL